MVPSDAQPGPRRPAPKPSVLDRRRASRPDAGTPGASTPSTPTPRTPTPRGGTPGAGTPGPAPSGEVVRTDAPAPPPTGDPHDGSGPDGRPERRTTIEEPAKIMRIGEMIKRLLEEVRSAPLDEAARARLAEVHERSLAELEDGLSPDLVEELHRISLPFTDDAVPSEAELRIAQAQLVGWLEGLFHGLQTALVAQQMAAQAQLQQMRGGQRALPPGLLAGAEQAADDTDGRPTPGQYL